MHLHDSAEYLNYLRQLPDQISKADSLISAVDFKKLAGSYRSVVICGMGGSAIAGDLARDFLKDELKIPLTVNRNYTLPGFVTEDSLVIACSYSGNTEETLTACGDALARGARVLGISSGGKLTELGSEKNFPVIKIPEGLPPRQAIGYMFFPLLRSLEELGFIPSHSDQISETIAVLENMKNHYDPVESQGQNLPNHIAQKLVNRLPVIYSADPFLSSVTYRWRTQLNENAKVLAFNHTIPEMNHNEIMGWEAPGEILANLCVLFLRTSEEYDRNRRRLEITRDLLRKRKTPIFEVYGEGKSRLAQMFSQLYIGDWVSYYLAIQYDTNPMDIKSIDYLKEKLSQVK